MKFYSLIRVIAHLCFLSVCASHSTAVPTYAPVPPNARPPIPNPPGYYLQSFGQGAYLVSDGVYNNIFFVACDSVIVVDAPPTTGYNLLKAIRSVTSLPIKHLVYSHSHADHIGAAYLLGSPSNISIIAHYDTGVQLAGAPDPNRPAPTVTFNDTYTLKVCNQTLKLAYRGLNHEPGNIFIYAPLQKIVMLVDIVYPGWVPFDKLGEAEFVPGWIKAHDQILSYDFKHYVGGHLVRPGTRKDVLLQRDYVQDLFNTSKYAIIASGQGSKNGSNPLSTEVFLPPLEKANPNNPWAEFSYYIDFLADYVANETTKRWGSKLAGADVYDFSNAATMLESLRLDYGILGPFGVQGK